MKIKNPKIKYPEVRFRDIVSYFWRVAKKDWFLMVLSFFGVAIASAFEIVVPVYYKKFFDFLSLGGEKSIIAQNLIHTIFIVLALNGLAWFFWRIGTFASSYFEANSMTNLRRQAYDHLIHHSYGFFSNNFTGALVQRVNRYVRAFEKWVDRITWDLIPIFVRLFGVAIVTTGIEPRLTVIMVIWAVLYIAVNYFYAAWRLKYNIQIAEADSRTTAFLADTITNQTNVDIFNRHNDEEKNFDGITEKQKKITILNWNINTLFDGGQAALIAIIEFIIFYFAIRYWQVGSFEIGTFVLLQLYVIGLGSRLWGFSRIIRDFYEGYADAKEMVEVMKLPHEIKNIPSAKPLIMESGKINFANVGFMFNETRNVLKDISLEIKPGEKIALVGPSGAGKTTFVRLLLRFYDVTDGEILIDGQNIQKVTLESLRDNIAFVPQDPLLFHRTIKENIRYGKPEAADEEVIEAAHLAHCDNFVNGLPDKYETYVGERGIKLSGGERQRVAIARAILKNAPILILDEATSSLDSHSESLIQDALDNLIKGKTTIVVAHRLSTIKKMDRIIVIADSSIKEQGTHDELISKKGIYNKLWSLQSGGFIKNNASGTNNV